MKDPRSSGMRAGLFRCELHVCMLTRNRLRRGEGKLKYFDPEAGHALRRRRMAHEEDCYEEELNFRKTFYTMAESIGQLLSRLEKEKGKKAEEQGSVHGNGEEEPPPPSTSESYSSSHHHHHRNSRDSSKKPFFNLDVKFELPMFNGESNAERLSQWIRQIEIYCSIQ